MKTKERLPCSRQHQDLKELLLYYEVEDVKMLGPQDFHEESSVGNSKPFKILLLGKQLTLYLNAHMRLHRPYITHHLLCVRPAHEAFRIVYLRSQHTYDSDLGWTAVNPESFSAAKYCPGRFTYIISDPYRQSIHFTNQKKKGALKCQVAPSW